MATTVVSANEKRERPRRAEALATVAVPANEKGAEVVLHIAESR